MRLPGGFQFCDVNSYPRLSLNLCGVASCRSRELGPPLPLVHPSKIHSSFFPPARGSGSTWALFFYLDLFFKFHPFPISKDFGFSVMPCLPDSLFDSSTYAMSSPVVSKTLVAACLWLWCPMPRLRTASDSAPSAIRHHCLFAPRRAVFCPCVRSVLFHLSSLP